MLVSDLYWLELAMLISIYRYAGEKNVHHYKQVTCQEHIKKSLSAINFFFYEVTPTGWIVKEFQVILGF